jgi:hypothetical protein
MRELSPSVLLKRALYADAAVSGAVGLLQLTTASELSTLTALSESLLLRTGLFLLGYVALLLFLATRRRVEHRLLWLVIVGNLLWAVAAVSLASTPTGLPPLGVAFVLAQALAVVSFAALQYFGLRASSPQPAVQVAEHGQARLQR